MSADNGVYIAKFPRGYRVKQAMAIDNLWFYAKGSIEEYNQWLCYFGTAWEFAN